MDIIGQGQLTLTDSTDPIISTTMPTNATLDTLWLDTSLTPAVLKRSDGNGNWIVSALTGTDIDKAVVGLPRRNYAQQTATPSTSPSFYSINNQTYNIYSVLKDIGSKKVTVSFSYTFANLTLVSAQTNRIYPQLVGYNGSENTYQGLAPNLNLQNGTFNYSSTVTLATSSLNGYIINIRADYISGGTLTINNFKVEIGDKATDWNMSIEDVQTNIDKVKIGGRNLVIKSTMVADTGITIVPNEASPNKLSTLSGFGFKLPIGSVSKSCRFVMASGTLKKNTEYMASFIGWTTTGTQQIFSDLFPDSIMVDQAFTLTNIPTKYTWKVSSSDALIESAVSLRFFYGGTASTQEVTISDVKFEIGNKFTDWTPAPEDVQIQIDGAVNRISTAESSITENARLIALTVNKTDVQSVMNTVVKVRYIRDWVNGSTANTGHFWQEIKAMQGITNLALNKTVTSNFTPNYPTGAINALSKVTDGITLSDSISTVGVTLNTGAGYVQVDLGATYEDIDYLTIWHYYADGRTFHNTKTEVSTDGVIWKTLFDSAVSGEYVETVDGHSFNVNMSDIVSRMTVAEASLTVTSTAITQKVWSSDIKNEVDKIQVGGRNLLMNSSYANDISGTSNRGSYHIISRDTVNTNNGNNSLKIVCSTVSVNGTNDVWQGLYANCIVGQGTRVSFYVKGTVATTGWIRFGGATSFVPNVTFDITTAWTKVDIDLGLITATGTVGSVELIYGFNAIGTYYMNSMKLEYSNKATDWTPAPEDVQASINAVAMQTGGRNLLTDSSFEYGTLVPYIINGGVNTITTEDKYSGTKSWKCVASVASNVSGGYIYSNNLTIGSNYIASLKIKSPTAENVTLLIFTGSGFTNLATKQSALGAGQWTTLSIPFTATETSHKISIYNGSLKAITYYVDNVKVELGNVATDWCPALEDEQANIQLNIDAVKVGGRNLLPDSSFELGKYVGVGLIGCTETYPIGSSSSKCLALTSTITGDRYKILTFPSVPMGTYVFSFAVAGSKALMSMFGSILVRSAGSTTYGSMSLTSFPTTWDGTRYSFPVVVTALSTNMEIILRPPAVIGGDIIYFDNLKLEVGNKATDWTPAVEDVQGQIDATTMTFTKMVGCTATGNTVTSTGTTGWGNSGFSGTYKFKNGDYAEFSILSGMQVMFGLSVVDTNITFTTIEFAIYPDAGNILRVYESGTNIGSFGSWALSDTFGIGVNNNKISYYKNGEVIYTSLKTPTLPMVLDVSFYNLGTSIGNIKVSPILGSVASISRMYSAEQKITADAIINTVSKSTMSSSSPLIKVDDSDANITYSGTGWNAGTNAVYFNSTRHLSSVTNDYAQYTFLGTGVEIYGYRGVNGGIHEVSIDGITKTPLVDTFSSTEIYQSNTPLYSIVGLTYGTHTVKIRVTGTKNANVLCTNYSLALDYFQVLNSNAIDSTNIASKITQNADSIISTISKSVESSGSPSTIIDDTDPNIIYTGVWTHDTGITYYNSTCANYSSIGDSIQYTFFGTGFNLYGFFSPYSGICQVYIDNVWMKDVDMYASQFLYDAFYFDSRQSTTLEYGVHTLKLITKNTKNSASSDFSINLDYIEILNSNAVDASNFGSTLKQSGTDFQYTFNQLASAKVTISPTGLTVTNGAISGTAIVANTITADKLTIGTGEQGGYLANPRFSHWAMTPDANGITYPDGASAWSTSIGSSKQIVDTVNVVQFACVTPATTQYGMNLSSSFFANGINIDGLRYFCLEARFRLTVGTSANGACFYVDVYNRLDATYERMALNFADAGATLTPNTWYTIRKICALSSTASVKTFKYVSGYLLGNYTGATGGNMIKTIQIASVNMYQATEQDYLSQSWTAIGKTTINGGMIEAGSISADKIYGNTLTLGGASNTNGSFVCKDASNNTIVAINNTGITVTAGVINATAIKGGTLSLGGSGNGNGSFVTKDALGNTVVTIDNNGMVVTKGSISGDVISGGTITGAVLKTSNGSDYVNIQNQFIQCYSGASQRLFLGFSGVGTGIHLYSPNGTEGTISQNDNSYLRINPGLDIAGDVLVYGGMKASGYMSLSSQLIGDYDLNVTANKMIWTIGDSWNSWANHYGLAYEYGNNAGMGTDHQLTIRHAGATHIRMSFNGNIATDGKMYAIAGYRGLGKLSAFTWTGSVPCQPTSKVNVTHNLGYNPIVSFALSDGGAGANVQLTYRYIDLNTIEFGNYSSGSNSINCRIYCW